MVTILLALCLAGTMGACESSSGSPKENASSQEAEKEPLDLTGTWTQENASDSYQEAVITDDTIEIYWISESESMRSVYWSGTYTAPSDDAPEYSWTSEGYSEKMDMALLASQDDTKEFTYKDGKISYEVSMMGTTKTVDLVQTSEDVPDYYTDAENEATTVDVPEEPTVTFENDTLSTEEATIKITGFEVVSNEHSSIPYTLVISCEFTNNGTEILRPDNIWNPHFVLTQETDSTIEQLDGGPLPSDSPYREAHEMFRTDIKPGATLQIANTYGIEDISHPVTLTVYDRYKENVIGTKIIELQ